jgi:hypothetical protein
MSINISKALTNISIALIFMNLTILIGQYTIIKRLDYLTSDHVIVMKLKSE